MAEGYLRHYAGNRAEIYSAGIETHGVNPKAIAVMAEAGIDISRHTSNHLDEYSELDFDFVITVCDNAQEHCPFFPGNAEIFHHNFPDPAKANGTQDEVLAAFRATRDQINDYCKAFAGSHF